MTGIYMLIRVGKSLVTQFGLTHVFNSDIQTLNLCYVNYQNFKKSAN